MFLFVLRRSFRSDNEPVGEALTQEELRYVPGFVLPSLKESRRCLRWFAWFFFFCVLVDCCGFVNLVLRAPLVAYMGQVDKFGGNLTSVLVVFERSRVQKFVLEYLSRGVVVSGTGDKDRACVW